MRPVSGGPIVKAYGDYRQVQHQVSISRLNPDLPGNRCGAGDVGFHKGRPLAAMVIFRCCLQWKAFQADRTSLFDKIINTMGSQVRHSDRARVCCCLGGGGRGGRGGVCKERLDWTSFNGHVAGPCRRCTPPLRMSRRRRFVPSVEAFSRPSFLASAPTGLISTHNPATPVRNTLEVAPESNTEPHTFLGHFG